MLWGPYGGPELRRFMVMGQYNGQNQRERLLQELEACWLGIQYDDRPYLWDGHPADSSGMMGRPKDMPERRERIPCVQSGLGALVVSRFTDMLFGEGRRSEVTVLGDPASTDWISAAWEQADGWAQLVRAREYGGAMGSAVLLVRLKDGRYRLDPLNPRQCSPTWLDQREGLLTSLEQRYQYTREVRGADGVVRDKRFWFRRLIDEGTDSIWRGVPVTTGEGLLGEPAEPQWGEPDESYAHGLGVCPVVWVQNEQVDDEADGRSDIDGQASNIEQLDYVLSEGAASTVANLDATVVLTRTHSEEVGVLRTGRFTTLCLPQEGAEASFLELSGTGLQAGDTQATRLRTTILERCQCVLVDPEKVSGLGQGRDLLEALYRPMLARCDKLRVNYGRMIRQVCDLVLLLGRKGLVLLPPAAEQGQDGKTTKRARALGPGGSLELSWGPYFAPTADDRQKATTDADTAKRGGLLSRRTLVRHLAPYYGVQDVDAELAALEEEIAAEEQRRAEAAARLYPQGGGRLPPGQNEDDEPDAGADAEE